MKILLLTNEAPEDFALREDSEKFDAYIGEWYAFGDALKQAGALGESAALEAPSTATVISVRDGVRKVEDGPFPDTKEQLGGFGVIDVADMDRAVEWAAKCPAAKNGFVELRPVPFLEEGDAT